MLARSTLRRLAVCLSVMPAGAASQSDEIPWADGRTRGALGPEATLSVPAGCLFTGVDGVKMFLQLTENIASGNERGVVMCQGDQTADPWFVLFSYDKSGYVRDDEGSKLDADAILETVQRGTEAANRERKSRGWGTLSVEGWATKPFYDRTTNNLTWAITAPHNTGGRTVNHSVRLLARGGVMHADPVTTPQQLAAPVPTCNGMISGFTYQAGQKYAERRPGDKGAAQALTARGARRASAALQWQ